MSAKRKRRTHGRARAAARLARTAAAIRCVAPPGNRLCAARSALLLIDVQERVAGAVADAPSVIAHCTKLLRAAGVLGVPILVTEHCPDRLGATVAAVRSLLGTAQVCSKTHFSAADEPAIARRVAAFNRPQLVIAGLEAHVCVLQSALAFAERGLRPFVVADAIGARSATSHTIAVERMRAAQVPIVTTEMVLFEWLEHADRPELNELLALVK